MALTTWLSDRYSTIGNQLGWTIPASYNLIVEDTLELMGIESEDEVDAIDLHSVAAYVLFKKALVDVSLDYDVSADGSSYKRSQLHAQIKENLTMARDAASAWLEDSDVIIQTIRGNDPYQYNEDRDNAGL